MARCIRMICPNLGGSIHKFIVFNLFSTQLWVKMSPPLKPSINVMDMRQDTSRDAAVKLCPSYSITASLNGSLGREGAGQYQPFTRARWILTELLVKHRLLIKRRVDWSFLNKRKDVWGTGCRPSADEVSFTLNTQTWPSRTLAWLITKAIPSTSQNRLTGALTLHFTKSWKCWDIDSICLPQAKRGQVDVRSSRIL